MRNRGTVGGALAQSDPTGEMPLACLALDARVVVRSVRGERTLAIDEFFDGSYANVLEPDELLVAVRLPIAPVPLPLLQVARKHNDFAVMSVIAAQPRRPAAAGTPCASPSAGSTTGRARGGAARGSRAEPGTRRLEAAAELALEVADPPDDVRATRGYRRTSCRSTCGAC